MFLQISQDEKLEIKEELSLSCGKVTNVDVTDIYKVPFEKVIDLVKGRKVYLKAGMAYITHMDLSSVFVSCLRENLVTGLEVCVLFCNIQVFKMRLLKLINLSCTVYRLQRFVTTIYLMTKD